MKTIFKSHRGLKALTTGIAALLLALSSIHIASAQGNTKTGVGAGVGITTGTNNTANGLDALRFTTTGSSNTAVGSLALKNNVEGGFNTALGFGALASNTNSGNTALGAQAMNKNITGARNTATGVNALFNNLTGSFNTATGRDALRANTVGTNNVAVGFEALLKNTNGGFNVAIGDGALQNNTTGSGNIALGEDAGFNLTVGDNNISIGHKGGAGESGKIRIGTNGTHTDTFLAGVVHGDGSGLTGVPAAQVGGVSAVNVALASNLANAATAQNTVSSIVRRDVNGNFSAGTITGSLVGNATNVTGIVAIANGGTGSVVQNFVDLSTSQTIDGTKAFTGNVGIGTPDPLRTLQIGPRTDALFTMEGADSAADAGHIRFGDSTGWKLHFGRSRQSAGGALNTGNTGTIMTIQDNGNVGIGTTTPQAKLDVRGDLSVSTNVKMGASSEFFAPAAEESLRIVRGVVTGRGGAISGAGFTVTQIGVGHFRVNFDRNFAAPPVVTATVTYDGEESVATTVILDGQPAARGFSFYVLDSGFHLIDANTHFIAIGPRVDATAAPILSLPLPITTVSLPPITATR